MTDTQNLLNKIIDSQTDWAGRSRIPYDNSNILGVRPDLEIEIRDNILDEIDGPMLKHGLQEMHGGKLLVPRKYELRPHKDSSIRDTRCSVRRTSFGLFGSLTPVTSSGGDSRSTKSLGFSLVHVAWPVPLRTRIM